MSHYYKPCILKLQLFVIHPVCMAERAQTPGLVSVPLLTLEENVKPACTSTVFAIKIPTLWISIP